MSMQTPRTNIPKVPLPDAERAKLRSMLSVRGVRAVARQIGSSSQTVENLAEGGTNTPAVVDRIAAVLRTVVVGMIVGCGGVVAPTMGDAGPDAESDGDAVVVPVAPGHDRCEFGAVRCVNDAMWARCDADGWTVHDCRPEPSDACFRSTCVIDNHGGCYCTDAGIACGGASVDVPDATHCRRCGVRCP